MSLGERLERIREAARARVPEATRLVMERAIEDLRREGIAGRAVKAGDQMPEFTLPSAGGRTVSSADLLARGPLVVSFYRGRW